MTDNSLSLEQPTAAETERIEAMLEANGLPTDDVRAKLGEFFLAYVDGKCIGTGGVEMYGSAALLRSVVVTEPNRGSGYGIALCHELESYARRHGVEQLYLLTTTAEEFFRQRGYEPTARADAPQSIQETAQFTALCPDSATCLRKSL